MGEGVALGARRLEVFDLGRDARMPMAAEDERTWLVFNGEIYNFVELRSELEACGHRFRQTGDTQVVLRAYLEWGDECCRRLEGMFAFAVWDARRHRLFAVRDRLGVKPFSYAQSGSRFAFASGAHAIRRVAEAMRPGARVTGSGSGFLWRSKSGGGSFCRARTCCERRSKPTPGAKCFFPISAVSGDRFDVRTRGVPVGDFIGFPGRRASNTGARQLACARRPVLSVEVESGTAGPLLAAVLGSGSVVEWGAAHSLRVLAGHCSCAVGRSC